MAIIKEGSTAIITGGSSGIGFQFASILNEKRINVLIADLELSKEAEELCRNTQRDGGNRAVFQKTDVTSWSELDAMFKAAEKQFGTVDLVCPCAGVFEPPTSNFWRPPGHPNSDSNDDVSENRYKTLDINITHPVRLTQLAIEYFMAHNKPGHVLLVSSIAAQTVAPMKPMYAASKAAISSFTRCMGMLSTPPEGIPKVVVNAVAPGMTISPLWTKDKREMEPYEKMGVEWVQPVAVAEVMCKMVMTDEYAGGQVVEVTKDKERTVETLNDPGPPMMQKLKEMSQDEIKEAVAPTIKPVLDALGKMMGSEKHSEW